MNWAWATSLDQLWRSPTFPMWLTLAAAAFFGIIVLITLLRAEKSVANGALTVITLLAIAVAGAATIRSFGQPEQGRASGIAAPLPPLTASLPALSCLDELAGDTVLAACEKVLFGSAEASAAAVSYAAAKLSRLTSYGDIAAADKIMTPELMALRHAVERDRYGLVAFVLLTREHCQITDCAAYAALTDHNQIAANMEQRIYDGLIARYAPTWNAPPSAATGVLAGLPPSVPTGKPTTADFPSAASIPPINIMTPEPPLNAPRSAPAAANAQAAATRPAAPKKPPAKPRPQPEAPVSLAPAAAPPEN
jgi:hypothetical protein